MNVQIRAEHSQLNNKLEKLERQQKEYEQGSQKKLEYLVRQGDPVVKQEKLIEKDPDGKEITRVSKINIFIFCNNPNNYYYLGIHRFAAPFKTTIGGIR